MKTFNEDKQLRSDWDIPICNGSERITSKNKKIHSTQKPEALLYREYYFVQVTKMTLF